MHSLTAIGIILVVGNCSILPSRYIIELFFLRKSLFWILQATWQDAWDYCCSFGMKLLSVDSTSKHACLTKLTRTSLSQIKYLRFDVEWLTAVYYQKQKSPVLSIGRQPLTLVAIASMRKIKNWSSIPTGERVSPAAQAAIAFLCSTQTWASTRPPFPWGSVTIRETLFARFSLRNMKGSFYYKRIVGLQDENERSRCSARGMLRYLWTFRLCVHVFYIYTIFKEVNTPFPIEFEPRNVTVICNSGCLKFVKMCKI